MKFFCERLISPGYGRLVRQIFSAFFFLRVGKLEAKIVQEQSEYDRGPTEWN
jgi:hypothetical protein